MEGAGGKRGSSWSNASRLKNPKISLSLSLSAKREMPGAKVRNNSFSRRKFEMAFTANWNKVCLIRCWCPSIFALGPLPLDHLTRTCWQISAKHPVCIYRNAHSNGLPRDRRKSSLPWLSRSSFPAWSVCLFLFSSSLSLSLSLSLLVQLHGQGNDWYAAYRARATAKIHFLSLFLSSFNVREIVVPVHVK